MSVQVEENIELQVEEEWRFPYLGDSRDGTQKIMVAVILPNVDPAYKLKDILQAQGHKRCIYREGHAIRENGNMDKIAIISGAFEDLEKIQFHQLNWVSYITYQYIEDYKSVKELDNHIKIMLEEIEQGGTFEYFNCIIDVRNLLLKLLLKEKRKALKGSKSEKAKINKKIKALQKIKSNK